MDSIPKENPKSENHEEVILLIFKRQFKIKLFELKIEKELKMENLFPNPREDFPSCPASKFLFLNKIHPSKGHKKGEHCFFPSE